MLHLVCVKRELNIYQYIHVVGKTCVKRKRANHVAHIYYSKYVRAPCTLTYVERYIGDM